MKTPLFYLRAMLASWRQMHEIEQRTGRRLPFDERRKIAERTYHEAHNTDRNPE